MAAQDRFPAVDDVLRRRSVGAPAARSTLLTILGEFLLPRPDGAWQEALIGSLKLLGFTPSAARQAVVRSARENWLAGERVGRRSRMRLTASSAELLRDGARRIYGFGGPVSWDGRWLLLVLRVPEPRRELRHRLTTQLAWAGLRLARRRAVDHAARGPRGAHQRRGARAAALLPRRAGRAGRQREGDRRGVGPARAARALRAVHRRLHPAPTARRRIHASPPRPRSCTRGGASRSSTPTCPTTCSRATGRAGARYELFTDRHERWAPAAQEHFDSLA